MICSGCGEALSAGAKFCPECGQRAPTAAESVLEPPVISPPPPRSGRRQITALFCDLVNSVGLAEAIDAEDLREVLFAYQRSATDVIEQAHGQIVRFFGDGILAIFGHPVAREDDARAAVRAALTICERLPALSRPVEARHGVGLSVRIGMHTGSVVIDDAAPASDGLPNNLIGHTLNVGARLQEFAPRNGVVISRDTLELVRGHFIVEPLGTKDLRGVSRPLQVFQVIEQSSVRSVFEARASRGLSPLVGRAAELATLEAEWATAREGRPRSVLLSGDPGIGKSRLLYEFQLRRERDDCIRIIFNCFEQYQNTAFFPITGELARIFRITGAETPTQLRERVRAGLRRVGIEDQTMTGDISRIFADTDTTDDADGAADGQGDPNRVRDRVIGAIIRYVAAGSARVPLLLIFEDLHWADPTTLALLHELCTRLADARVLMLGTLRPFTGTQVFAHRTLDLHRFGADDCRALIASVPGAKALSDQLVGEVLSRSDGVPLFVEELTRAVVELGGSPVTPGLHPNGDYDPDAVPATLQDSITARLDRLGSAKELAQVGALIGRRFRPALLAHVWDGDRRALADDIARLIEAEILFQHATTADSPGLLEFKHELVRGVASRSMLRDARRAIHGRIAATLAHDFADECARHPELLAHHYTEAGAPAAALPLWERAGRRAVRASANQEAIAHFGRALSMLEGLPPGPERDARELDLHIGIASPLIAVYGYGAPAFDRTIERAMAIGQAIGDTERVFPMIYGRWSFDQVTGNLRRSRDLALRTLALTDPARNVEQAMVARRIAGSSLFSTAEPARAVALLEQALALFDDASHRSLAFVYGSDVAVVTQCALAFALLVLGARKRAHDVIEQAWSRTLALGHLHTTAYCSSYRLAFHAIAGDTDGYAAILDDRDERLAEHPLPLWAATAEGCRGWFALRQGDADASAARLRHCLERLGALKTLLWQPTVFTWLAEAEAARGDMKAAEAACAASADLMARTGECWAEPELLRVWAEVRRPGDADGADALLSRALAAAAAQGAYGWAGRICADATVAADATGARPRTDLLHAAAKLAAAAANRVSDMPPTQAATAAIV